MHNHVIGFFCESNNILSLIFPTLYYLELIDLFFYVVLIFLLSQ